MKIAIVHDYLIDFGGAEQVLLTLHKIYPQAPIYTLMVDKKGMGKFWEKFEEIKIVTSWFGKIPFASKLISPLRFLLPVIWNSFNFENYDLVISSASWAITKGFVKGSKTKEICYLHTPPRYLYGYDTSRNWKGKWFAKLVEFYALIVNHFMRMYDFQRAQKVNYFIANSENVGQRITKFYRRDYKVIYPPVDVEEIISEVKTLKENNFLTGGRMVASKNFDIIIKACAKAKVNLKIYGSGIDEKRLKELRENGVEFLGRISREELIGEYKKAKAFIVAQQDEDFGITPVESMAAGTPVIAYGGGGYVETVEEGKTGMFFDGLNVESLANAINKFNKMSFNGDDCINQAKKFSKERFIKEIKSFVNSKNI